MGIHILHCSHGGERTALHNVVWDVFCGHSKRCEISCLTKANPCPSTSCHEGFTSLSWHCAINWWCWHVGRCCCHQSIWVDLVSQGIFSCKVVVTISSNERWSLSQLVLDGHVFLSNCRGFWILTPISRQVFSSMC
jgi:hypothetical protein